MLGVEIQLSREIVYVVNNPDFLISHRLEICLKAQDEGYQVHIICPEKPSVHKLIDLGFQVYFIDFGRNRLNPFAELRTIFQLSIALKRLQPDVVHLITIKPYLYGGIAARIVGVKSVVSAVAGLGIVFSSSQLKYRLLRLGLYPLFKWAFGHKNQSIIFQNADDCNALVNWGIVSENKVRMIHGSGVDLATYTMVEEPSGVPVISFAARLLKDKGVEILVEASRLLKQRSIDARFWLIGELDSGNATFVSQAQLDNWEEEGVVEFLGFRKDIPELFARSNIVTLPSFYGEGLPKVLIEAAACGRAVVTTNHSGCRDAILPNKTGILVPVRDSQALADALQYLVEDPDKRKLMGQKGRMIAEEFFDVKQVVDAHMKIYRELLRKY